MTQFALNNPITTAIMFYVLCFALTRPFSYWAKVQHRKLRSLDIQKHGWPKAPLDADGNIGEREDEFA